MAEVYLALGANVGDTRANLKKAIDLLGKEVTLSRFSQLYITRPAGYMEQGNFMNMAVGGRTDLEPHALLKFVKRIEVEVGRVKRFRNGPREIDIDIILYGNTVCKDSELEIPHPRFHERDFVLRPLMDIDPSLYHQVLMKTVEQLYSRISKEDTFIIACVGDL